MPSVVIAGASGLVGSATLENVLSRQGWSDVVAVSRRVPEVDTTRTFQHLSVDLRDAEAARAALKDLRGVTHLVYTALYEQPGLIEGWSDPDASVSAPPGTTDDMHIHLSPVTDYAGEATRLR